MADILNQKNPKTDDSWYRRRARDLYHDEGVLEVDENAIVSQVNGQSGKGTYVQAWIWISDSDIQGLGDRVEAVECEITNILPED